MIRGSRIYFKPLEWRDVGDEYLRWMNDPDVVQYLEIHRPQTLEDLNQYWKAHFQKEDEPWFGIFTFPEDSHIGNIKLGPINWIHRRADISLFIGRKDLWKKGYGTEAINLMTEYAFKTLNLHKVMAGVYCTNVGSRRAFQKAGFDKESALVDHVWTEEGYIDLLLYSRFSEPKERPYEGMEFSE